MEHIFKPENNRFISKRLHTRIILFLGISLVLLGIIAYDVLVGQASWEVVLIGLLVGIVIGFIYGRLSRLRWHESEEKIVRQNDMLAYIIIAAYILLGYARDVFLQDFLTGQALLVVSLAVASGVLLGRFFGMHVVLMRMISERHPS